MKLLLPIDFATSIVHLSFSAKESKVLELLVAPPDESGDASTEREIFRTVLELIAYACIYVFTHGLGQGNRPLQTSTSQRGSGEVVVLMPGPGSFRCPPTPGHPHIRDPLPLWKSLIRKDRTHLSSLALVFNVVEMRY